MVPPLESTTALQLINNKYKKVTVPISGLVPCLTGSFSFLSLEYSFLELSHHLGRKLTLSIVKGNSGPAADCSWASDWLPVSIHTCPVTKSTENFLQLKWRCCISNWLKQRWKDLNCKFKSKIIDYCCFNLLSFVC